MYVLMSIKRSYYMTPPAIELKSDFIHVQHMLLIASDEPYLITRSKVVKIFLYKFCPCCFNFTLATDTAAESTWRQSWPSSSSSSPAA